MTVIDWCARNDTNLSLPKCNSMIASTRQKISHDPNYIPLSVVLDGCPIACMYSTKIVGVLADPVLSWQDHINTLVRKLLEICISHSRSKTSFHSMPEGFLWTTVSCHILTTAVLCGVTAQSVCCAIWKHYRKEQHIIIIFDVKLDNVDKLPRQVLFSHYSVESISIEQCKRPNVSMV